jgi:lipopolysaccharide/colanic/teichoic acid biosynthesis glycosyltransferase
VAAEWSTCGPPSILRAQSTPSEQDSYTSFFAPFILVVALAIKADSRRPVLYRCRRVGSRGREFWMLKFLNMHDRATGPALTVSEDTRLTPVGRFLARSKIDEIPELWRVLRGRTGLVGPRPQDPGFRRAPPDFDVILQAKPGITGLSLTLGEDPGPLSDALLHSASTSPEEPTRSWN